MNFFVCLLYTHVSPEVRQLKKKLLPYRKGGEASFGRLPSHRVSPSALLRNVFLLLCSIVLNKAVAFKWCL